jgi:hypothetical protein
MCEIIKSLWNRIKTRWNSELLFKYKIILGISTIAILLLPAILTQLPYCLVNFNLSETGQVGDTIGGIVNPFVALIAVWFTFKAFWVQYDANEKQKEINKKQEERNAEQDKKYDQQVEDIAIQRFENNFFQMLNLQQEIVNGLYFSLNEHQKYYNVNDPIKKSDDTIVTGRTVFKWLYNRGTYYGLKTSSNNIAPEGIKYLIKEFGYEKYVEISSISCLDHYFRHLYRIFKYVYDSRALLKNFDQEYKYTSIIRAQLSDYELILLFYNCLSKNGKDRFKKYAERYALFNNIRNELLVDEKVLKEYSNSAYEKEQPSGDIQFS